MNINVSDLLFLTLIKFQPFVLVFVLRLKFLVCIQIAIPQYFLAILHGHDLPSLSISLFFIKSL